MILAYSFLFCGIFFWFWYQGDSGLIEWVWAFSFLNNFLGEFDQDRYQVFSKLLVEFICGIVCEVILLLIFFGKFFITILILVFVIGLTIVSLSSWFRLDRYTSLRICAFLPGYLFYPHIFLIVVSYDPFYFCEFCCNFSIFISDFIDLSPLPFFSWWFWLTVCQFCLSPQRTNS